MSQSTKKIDAAHGGRLGFIKDLLKFRGKIEADIEAVKQVMRNSPEDIRTCPHTSLNATII
jgi:hypothetical protein